MLFSLKIVLSVRSFYKNIKNIIFIYFKLRYFYVQFANSVKSEICPVMTPYLKSDSKFLALVHRVEEVSKATREGRINAIRVVLRWFFYLNSNKIFGMFWKYKFDLDRFMCPSRLLSHLIHRLLRYHTSQKTGFLQMSNLRLFAGF